jgi:LCP family protein required for cell wall assembly
MRAAAVREEARRDRDATFGYPGDRETAPHERITRRRRPPLKRIAQVVVLAALALLIVGGFLLWQRVSAFNDKVSTASAASTALFGPLNGKDRVNVVMIGYAGEAKHGGTYLADSINILSIDPQSNTTTVVPIPRDFWVEGAPELPNNGKINEVFAVGWAKGGMDEAASAMAKVLGRVTGLKIDHWMAIDFEGFQEMVDAVGGVTIDNPRAFGYTWNETDFHAGNWNGGSFKKGTLHLNGKQALDYARSRYTSVPAESSDFARSVRQQRILGALKGKLGSGGIGSLGPGLALMDAMAGRLKTDLSAIDLGLLSGHLNADRRVELKEDVILQAARNSAGQYILVVIGRRSATDYQPLHDWLAAQLAKPIPSPSASASARAG